MVTVLTTFQNIRIRRASLNLPISTWPFNSEAFDEFMNDGHTYVCVFRDERMRKMSPSGATIGFYAYNCLRPTHLSYLYVHERFRGRGFGKSILNHYLAHVIIDYDAGAVTTEALDVSQAFFESQGFTRHGNVAAATSDDCIGSAYYRLLLR